MLEVAEGIRIPVCGSTYAHDCMIDFDCEVFIPLNMAMLQNITRFIRLATCLTALLRWS